MIPDWKHYEEQIFELIQEKFPKAKVSFDDNLKGEESNILRQIDISISFTKNKKRVLGIAECKCFNRRVGIGIVDALIGKMIDLHADFGIIYSTLGFTIGAERFASSVNIVFRRMPHKFLKDFGFIDSNKLDSDIFIQETEYQSYYCKKCEITNLYEIKIVRGFADFDEEIICPQCQTPYLNTRTDGGYKVIKRFNKKLVIKDEIDKAIIQHLLSTRKLWDKKYLPEWNINKLLPKNQLCCICHKKFSGSFPGSFQVDYKDYKICSECAMSQRTILIDFKKI
jgi:hypothetical protein